MATLPITTVQYLLNDYPKTLFPLTTTSFLVENYSNDINDYIYSKLLSISPDLPGFPMQQRCYASKRGYNLRRTVKLDPIAEYYIYDVVFRNKKHIRKDHRSERQLFGYRFKDGLPQSGIDAYAAYKSAIAEGRLKYSATLKVDVATYFNSIYHHDLVNSMRESGWDTPDVESLGRFLREINGGRSIDCLPQGLHATKVLGSEFLRFVDNSFKLKSPLMIRFLDDIHLFDTKENSLTSDLVVLQEILGEKGLSLNDSKTMIGLVSEVDIPKQIDEMKKGLLRARRVVVNDYDMKSTEETEEAVSLTEKETEYLLSMLQSPDIEESDAELIFTLLREHSEVVLPHLRGLLERYPGLTRNLHNYAVHAANREGLDDIVADFLASSPLATECQLFWLTKIAEDYFSTSPRYGKMLMDSFQHHNSTPITRAKVLEIDDKRFGLPDLREESLRSGASNWESWSAAVGMRGSSAAVRNHILPYFAKGSPLNSFIASCLQKLS